MQHQSLPIGTHKKVIVAMSGGVDSSVAAALLKRADFNVSGVFMSTTVPAVIFNCVILTIQI